MIEALFIACQSGQPLKQVENIALAKGLGIIGDRNFNRTDYPGQNITFIAQEAIAEFNRDCGQQISAIDTRRNVVTSGVNLNDLVGKCFWVGKACFKGVELCEPCKALGNQLANDALSSAQVVKALRESGGLRADILNDGEIETGMTISLTAPSE